MKINWGHGIFAFLILFLVLSIVFIVFALTQNHDLVAKDYYNKGANYSEQISVNKRSLPYSDSIDFIYNDTSLVLSVCKSMLLMSDSLNVYFYRPSDKHLDLKRRYLMSDQINISLKDIISGRYILKISWNSMDELYYLEKELNVK